MTRRCCSVIAFPEAFLGTCSVFSRHLGEVNERLGGRRRLAQVIESVLREELSVKVRSTIQSIRSRPDGTAAPNFYAELELLSDQPGESWPGIVDSFLVSDADLARVVEPGCRSRIGPTSGSASAVASCSAISTGCRRCVWPLLLEGRYVPS